MGCAQGTRPARSRGTPGAPGYPVPHPVAADDRQPGCERFPGHGGRAVRRFGDRWRRGHPRVLLLSKSIACEGRFDDAQTNRRMPGYFGRHRFCGLRGIVRPGAAGLCGGGRRRCRARTARCGGCGRRRLARRYGPHDGYRHSAGVGSGPAIGFGSGAWRHRRFPAGNHARRIARAPQESHPGRHVVDGHRERDGLDAQERASALPDGQRLSKRPRA